MLACSKAIEEMLKKGLWGPGVQSNSHQNVQDDPIIPTMPSDDLFTKVKKALGKTASSPGDLPPEDDKKNSNNCKGQEHHICTDKNEKSDRNGGPWTPRFKPMFDKAGMNMKSAENIVRVEGHFGPHPEAYHKFVYNFLDAATKDLEGAEYNIMFRRALGELAKEIETPGSPLNKLITKP